MKRKPIPNRFGHITEITVNRQIESVTMLTADGYISEPFEVGPPTVEFSGVAIATGHVVSVLEGWMGGDGMPIYQPEWMCLYCATPNNLPAPHCHKCGAPRNWLLG